MYKTVLSLISFTSSFSTRSCRLTRMVHVKCVHFGHFTVSRHVTHPRFRELSQVRAVSNYLRPIHCTTHSEPGPRFALFQGYTVTNSGHHDPSNSVILCNPHVRRLPQFLPFPVSGHVPATPSICILTLSRCLPILAILCLLISLYSM